MKYKVRAIDVEGRQLTVRGMLLIATGLVLLLDVFGIVQEGMMVFLAFLAILAILYGLSLLGTWRFISHASRGLLTRLKQGKSKVTSLVKGRPRKNRRAPVVSQIRETNMVMTRTSSRNARKHVASTSQRSDNARKAAKARAARQSKEERSAIARKAARARWSKVKASSASASVAGPVRKRAVKRSASSATGRQSVARKATKGRSTAAAKHKKATRTKRA